MYDMDVLTTGEIGGYCNFNQSLLKSNIEQISTLQSWAPELQHFTKLDVRPFDKDSKICDRYVKTPTFLMKIDASTFTLPLTKANPRQIVLMHCIWLLQPLTCIITSVIFSTCMLRYLSIKRTIIRKCLQKMFE